MTAQQLRVIAESVIEAREDWKDATLEPNGLQAWSKLHRAREAFSDVCDPETILSLLNRLAVAEKDACRWLAVRDNRSAGLRLITWDPKAREEFQVLFPSQKLCNDLADEAIDAALNPAGEDVK